MLSDDSFKNYQYLLWLISLIMNILVIMVYEIQDGK